ncbi:Eco57I restriction-modification methylase domain-containing protein [Dictyobacter arantiisoli]|uniref:site-specific DNA-methyltransferase (adenine-specific) n=1 Tax=Dictyobacter arantiisoli TaxID=2014874 RepID=A0A5A5TAI6_9CHLR|nr:N-6 DNA methylase [Dictyobacter arantiisoli]GCF08501.1 hypothetical protein KDI_20650 [Dictyobacter arantiisoli]
MRNRQRSTFPTVTSEGALLPMDVLQRIAQLDPDLSGLRPQDYYHEGEKLNEVISASWSKVLRSWQKFQHATDNLSESQSGTTQTREYWLLPLFSELGYGRLFTMKPLEVGENSYPISHGWQHLPIHLVSYKVDLDQLSRGTTLAAGGSGSAKRSPSSLVQELLNRSTDHLWGMVSNGLQLRLLRKNISLTRLSYVEFDLDTMLRGELYADFVLLWLLCHQSRIEAERPGDCWLEKWSRMAQDQGMRILDKLRDGVTTAINTLGSGYLAHPANNVLKQKLRDGVLLPQDYYRQVLRFVYRMIVLFVAEDRDVLFAPAADEQAKARYLRYYSTARLRRSAEQRVGTRHADLYQVLWLVMEQIGGEAGFEGCPGLGLPALNGFLFSSKSALDLVGCQLANHDLLKAVRSLSQTWDNNVPRHVDYKNLGSEELGSVYESLLELHPELDIEAGRFELTTASGNERKTTGSYYTPTSLIDCLLDSALDPVLDEACRGKSKDEAQKAILDLKVCDPACGSGHFLIAAAHRIARRLAAVLTDSEEPDAAARRAALRQVVSHCIYGVDINPMAVELCKVNLWMEAIEPGKPLSFLDAHIQCGNSLLGTTPALLRSGIPDSAFDFIEGDDKKIVSKFKKENKDFRNAGQFTLFDAAGEVPWVRQDNLAVSMLQMEEMDDTTVEAIHRKEEQYNSLLTSSNYENSKLLADAWCAAFVWKKNSEFAYPITQEIFRQLEQNPYSSVGWMKDEIKRLADQYHFFHWHLAFPKVFHLPAKDETPTNEQTGWSGGFDVVLGNPPWERIKFQEKEWFASRHRGIANAANGAQRQQLIKKLAQEDPYMYANFLDDRRKSEGEGHFLRDSDRYPLCGRGDINTYAVFSENLLGACAPKGRVGCIVPSGIATDDTTKYFFQYLIEGNHLVSLFDFENRSKIFPAVDSRVKFCLLTLTGSSQRNNPGIDFMFFAHTVEDLKDDARRFTLSADDIALLNPNTKTCPIFRSRRDAELNLSIYRNLPAFVDEVNNINNWGIYYIRLVHLGDHADQVHFKWEVGKENWLNPLYESKLVNIFDHRYCTFADVNEKDCIAGQARKLTYPEKEDPNQSIIARYYLSSNFAHELFDKYPSYTHPWLLLWRDVTNATNERTCIATIIPKTLASVTCPALGFSSIINANVLSANLNSFVFDYVARQKVGGMHMTFSILKQLPAIESEKYLLPPQWDEDISLYDWVFTRTLELIYNAWDLEAFAQDCGYDGPPFRWDEERRFLLRCELDAAYFHLYGIQRADVDYIMETFPIVKRKDEKQYIDAEGKGEYRTKRVILDIYDEMQRAIESGVPYQTRLDPPPADPAVAHPPRARIEAWPSI